MSGSSNPNASASKPPAKDSTTGNTAVATSDKAAPIDQQRKKQQLQLEEDDEFEDFPVEDWPDSETTAAAMGAGEGEEGAAAGTQHLWEESWDDDDTSEDFAVLLKEELKKVEQAGKR